MSERAIIGPGRTLRGSTGCSAAAASRRAALPRTSPFCRTASIAYCEQDGWYLHVVGKSAPSVSAVEPDGATPSAVHQAAAFVIASTSSTRSPSQSKPFAATASAGRGARSARSRCRSGTRSSRARQTSRSCRLILLRSTAPPTARGTEKPKRGVGRLLLRKPVEDEEARRDRAAVAIDGVEVPRAGQTVGALHGQLTRGQRYAERRARPLARRRLRISAAGARRHARAEAVLALAASNVWLIGALHRVRKDRSREIPRSGRPRAASIAAASSTDLSTGAERAAMRKRGVSPTAFHSCGGISAALKMPAKAAAFAVIWHAAMLAARAFTREGLGVGVEHQIELTAESLWSDVSGRLRGALNDTTYGTWFGDTAGPRARRRPLRPRRPQRFHPRLDRGPFPRPDRRGHPRRHRRRAADRAPGHRPRRPPSRAARADRRRRRPTSSSAASSGQSRAGPRAAASTRSTPSTPSSSARRTASPTPPRSRSPKRRRRRTTRSSSTAARGSARRISCRRSRST